MAKKARQKITKTIPQASPTKTRTKGVGLRSAKQLQSSGGLGAEVVGVGVVVGVVVGPEVVDCTCLMTT